MKIIFSPTKEMNIKNPIDKDWNISEYTTEILKEYIKCDLQKILNINDSIFKTVNNYKNNLSLKKSYKAINLYSGISFRYLDPFTLNDNELQYLNQKLLICSAFYGPISPNTLIKAYRLDFNSRIKINGTNIKSFWKNKYDKYVCLGETIINLASEEFSSIFNKSLYNWIDFEFYEEKDGKLISHSTISKKGRGYILRQFAIKNISTVEQIFNEDYIEYYISKESSHKKIIFIKKS